jgi:leucyl-tRNA synthetase
VEDDVGGRFHFNTAISAVMELVNDMYKRWPETVEDPPAEAAQAVLRTSAERAVHLVAPMIPYVCEEMWSMLGYDESIFDHPFPVWDPAVLKTEMVTVVVQVNGKVRANIQAPAGASQQEVEDLAKQDPSVQKWIRDKSIRKTIYISDKILSFVV